MSDENKLQASELDQFFGTENYYQHLSDYRYTDGVHYVAERAGAYWLIDLVLINQMRPEIKREEFQVWVLKVDLSKNSATITCEDGNYNSVFNENIEFTTFPLSEIKFFVENKVMYLPSER